MLLEPGHAPGESSIRPGARTSDGCADRGRPGHQGVRAGGRAAALRQPAGVVHGRARPAAVVGAGRATARAISRAERGDLRGPARAGGGHHRAQRGGQVDPAQAALAHHRADVGRDPALGARRLAARGRDGLSSRADRAREHLPERGHPGHEAVRDPGELRRDRRLCRGGSLPRHAGQALLERHVRAARVRGRGAPAARDPDRRRGARGGRRVVPEEVPRQDAGRGRRRPHRALRQPQHVGHREALLARPAAPVRAARRRRPRRPRRQRLPRREPRREPGQHRLHAARHASGQRACAAARGARRERGAGRADRYPEARRDRARVRRPLASPRAAPAGQPARRERGVCAGDDRRDRAVEPPAARTGEVPVEARDPRKFSVRGHVLRRPRGLHARPVHAARVRAGRARLSRARPGHRRQRARQPRRSLARRRASMAAVADRASGRRERALTGSTRTCSSSPGRR